MKEIVAHLIHAIGLGMKLMIDLSVSCQDHDGFAHCLCVEHAGLEFSYLKPSLASLCLLMPLSRSELVHNSVFLLFVVRLQRRPSYGKFSPNQQSLCEGGHEQSRDLQHGAAAGEPDNRA